MTFKDDLYAAIKPLISDTLIWQDQNGPRPALPYCAMKVLSIRRVHMDHYSGVSDEGIQTVKGNREFTLTIQRYQLAGPVEVTTVLQDMVDRMQTTTAMDRFQNKGFACFNTFPVNDISALMGSAEIEKRASVDIFMRYQSVITDDVGIIETADVTGTDDGVNSPVYAVVVDV